MVGARHGDGSCVSGLPSPEGTPAVAREGRYVKYISTRGQSEPVDFIGACLAGLAPDGGLYVPETFPSIEPARPGEPYTEVAARILSAFAGDALTKDELLHLCERAYGSFAHQSSSSWTSAYI